MKMMCGTRKRWLWIAVVSLLVIGIVLGIGAYRQFRLNENRNNALTELEARRGEYDEHSIVLKETSPVEAKQLAERFGASLRITEDGKFAVLRLPEGTTILDIYADEANNAYIKDMQADYSVKIFDLMDNGTEEGDGSRAPLSPNYTVTDTLYSNQSYLNYVNIGKVWNTTKGSGVTVAVIDTGIDTDHPEFAGKISEYSYNATEDKIVKDYTANGTYDWSLIEDEQGHGTAVAGVIAAQMNGAGTVGIAPDVNLIIIKAECDEEGRFKRTSDLVFALYYAIERDVAVVNMSFGVASAGNPFESATRLALDSDVICVAAAGNEATTALTYPAADELVFGVGALEADGWELAAYSNYGENVNLVAPGTVYTTLKDGGYGVMNGTSFSSPIATAAIALYLSQNRYVEFTEVEEELYASCTDLGSLGEDFIYGYGALDVNAFVLGVRGTVTFHMLSDELENIEQIFVRGVVLQNIPEPERLYAVFDGWYYDAQCTEEYRWYEDVFTSDLTLYAKWANEDDGVPYTYVVLDDGTVEIRSYTGKRRFITVPDMIDGRIVSSIGDHAFYGQARLRRVTLPANLKKIGRSAFEGCLNLADISIPATVERIGERAFYGLPRLYAVNFEGDNKLTEIGRFALSFCGNLKRIELPSSLKKADGSVFYGATALEAISVRKGNKNFASKDGVLFNGTASELVAYPAGKRGEYTVPSAVKSIGDYAFGYALLTSVDFQNTSRIGDYAFSSSRLTSVDIADQITVMGKGAFSSCIALKSVSIGHGLKEISASAFYMTALSEIDIPAGIEMINEGSFARSFLNKVTFEAGSKLKMIGDNAFAFTYLESVEIPSSVISIGGGAFADCYALSTVVFANGSILSTIGGEAFARTVSLKAITLPENLRAVGEFAFLKSGLTEVTLPAAVTDLGAGAFADCDSLTAVYAASGNTVYRDTDGVLFTKDGKTLVAYPAGNPRTAYTVGNGVTGVGKAAFYGSDNFTSVQLPASLTDISEQAFYACTKLSSMFIPDNVVRIGRMAFAGDWNLYSITLSDSSKMARVGYEAFAYCGIQSFRVPSNVSTVAQGAFIGCDKLTSVTFARNSKLESISAYMFDGCTNLMSITFEQGSKLTSIQAHGLEGMRSLQSIDFGDAKLTNVDNFAFRFCESLQTLKLPETVTNIGRFAFYECKSLGELAIPSSLEHIGRYAFWGTRDVALYFKGDLLPLYLDDYWDEGVRSYFVGVSEALTSGDWRYAVHESGDISIIKYLGNEKNVDLTKLNLGGNIIAIGGKAFCYSGVESVVLPSTLKTIQAEAFYGSKLKSISIPKSVNFIGREAFFNSDLNTLVFEAESGLRVLERHAFAYTKSLSAVTLPASLEMMGIGVFEESGISSLSFENGFSMTEISERAFAGTKLQTVIVPDCVTLVNHGAFRDCLSLNAVNFGKGENLHIASNAFYNTGLTSVNIPANVGYIGEYAFVGLRGLTAFAVSADNPYYSAVDGLLMSKDGKKLIAVPAGRTGSLTVPASVEVIGFGAFENSALDSVAFAQNGNILTFGYRAFYNAQKIKSITVPASVVSVDYYAFANCTALESVIFAQGSELKGIYEGAFYGCKNLREIALPDSIVEISDFAFYGCSKITAIPVSETSSLAGIYSYAFAYTGITELDLPETLIDIGDYCFAGIEAKSVTVPDTNKEQLVIGIGAFAGCNKLESITVPFIGASFEDEEITWFGYIFGAGGYEANAAYVPESLKRMTVTEGISFVGEGGFYNLACLEEIDVPHSVTSLEPYAFGGTTARYELRNEIMVEYADGPNRDASQHFGTGIFGEVKLAEGLTELGYYAFTDCKDLKSVVLPKTLKSINYDAFRGCTGLTTITIPEGVTIIHGNAFADCENLTNIELPNSLTSIEYFAFRGSGLTSVTIPPNVTNIENSAFNNCQFLCAVYNNSNLQLEIGSGEHGNVAQYAKLIVDKNGNKNYRDEHSGFEYIDTADDFRFMKENGDYKLIAYLGLAETVTLPIDINGNSYEIYKMKGVRKVIIPEGITSIGDWAFYECKGLTSVFLPEGIMSIGYSAFDSCTDFVEINLPESLMSIGSYAFKDCAIMNIMIPDNVTDIGNYAFGGCSNLKNIILPDGVKSLGFYTFGGCSNLRSIVIPKGVVTLGDSVFSECINLTDIVIPDSVTDIGNYAFIGCKSLKSITIPSSVTRIRNGVFSDCSNVSIAVDKNNAFFSCIDGVLYDKDITRILFVPDSVTDICIPSTVTDISGAFSGNKGIKSVTIESGSRLTGIGDRTFFDCSNLTFVTIPKGITYIGYEAFSGCTSLTSIDIPEGVTRIAYHSFYDCSNLTSIVIPDGITTIESDVFSGCTGLKSVFIPESVTSIDDRAFCDCNSLISIDIPESVTYIGYAAFSGCSSLASVVIPDGVTSISSHTFMYCNGITSIMIPDSVTSIGDNAFASCGSLYVVYNNSNLEFSIGGNNHGEIAYAAKLIVDKNGNKMYRDGHSGFAYIDTADGFRFIQENGKYKLIAYLGAEETVTLPVNINGNSYEVCEMRGARNVIVPEGMTNIGDYAFRNSDSLISITIPKGVTCIGSQMFWGCDNLERVDFPDGLINIGVGAFTGCKKLISILIPDGVTEIGGGAFQNCTNLTDIVIPDSVMNIGEGAFDNTAYYNNPNNWESDALYIGNHLIKVSEDSEYFEMRSETQSIAQDALEGCYRLKKLTMEGNHSGLLSSLTNLETLVITEMPTHYVCEYFGSVWSPNLPITLKNIVLRDGVSMRENAFQGITGITIYVEATKVEAQHWDENFPNWHNGNKVVYGDDWITAEFFGVNGELVSSEIYRTAQVIRQPYYTVAGDGKYAYGIAWDIDGDGVADTVPATSAKDIKAHAIATKRLCEYTVNFLGVNGEILSSSVLHYGDAIPKPNDPSANGYTFNGWIGYAEGMTVSGDMNIKSSWTHAGAGHSYRKTTVAPGCETEGYDLFTCSVCGHSYTENKVAPKGHSFGEWATVSSPSCEQEGLRKHTCGTCGTSEEESVSALGHSYNAEQTKAPTCEIPGEIKYTCSCGSVAYGQTELAPHNYEKVTCTKQQIQILIENVSNMFYGYEGENVFYFACTDCKRVQTFEESTHAHAAAASTACTHVTGDWILAQEATCVDSQIEWQSCLLCEFILEVRTSGAPKGHSYDDHRFDQNTHWNECVCGLKQDIAQHSMSDWSVSKAPTCTEKGEDIKICAGCDYRETREVAPKGHSMGAWVISKAPTCTEKGEEIRSCADGDYSETREVFSKGHSHKAVVTAPTCTEQGYTTHTCPDCGDTYVDTYTDPLGHTWDDGVITLKPTVYTEGEKTFTCTVCADIRTESVAKYEKLDEIAVSGSDVKVETPQGSSAILHDHMILQAEKETIVLTDATVKNMKEAIGKKGNVLVAYDISLMLDGVSVQPGGKVSVTVPAPSDVDKYKFVNVVFIGADGSVTLCESQINEDGTITFVTDHFSHYAVVGSVKHSTVLLITISVIVMVLIAGGCTAFFLIKKKTAAETDSEEIKSDENETES